MQLDSILYIAYSDTSITVTIVLALLFWNRRNADGARPMAVMMAAAAIWGFGDFVSDLSSDFGVKVLWDNLSYLGVVAIPVAWLVFTLQYTKREKYLTRRNFLLLCIIPAITILMIWTNDFHHLMLAEKGFVKTGQMTVLQTTFGDWFWIHAVYSYSLLLLGTILLIRKIAELPSFMRSQSKIILAAIAVPFIMSILFMFKANSSYPIDPTIFSFTLTGILCFFGMFRYKLFELVPAARDAVTEGMSGIVIVLDNHNHIIYINSAAKSFLGGEEEQFLGKPVFELSDEWRSQFIKYENKLNLEEKISVDTRKGRKHFDLKITPLYDNRNKLIGKFLTLYDITALEEAIDDLRESRRAAEAANEAKSRFLAIMSHEIRTPLNGIIGMADLLASAGITGEKKAYLGTLQSCAGSLLDIINDILDFSKIEAGKMELENTGFSLKNIMDDTAAAFFHQVKDRDMEFACDVDPGIPEVIIGDPVRVRQILVNLIGNAFKFTQKGSVKVSAKQLSCRDGQVTVRITVSDTGIGIPEGKIPQLFNSFQQVDSSTTRKYGGTGLGLAIVKNLVSMMNGSIAIESTLGKGSSFVVEIPFGSAQKAGADGLPTVGSEFYNKNIHVLLAEDNKANQLLISKLLTNKGIKVDIAGNGKDALSRVESGAYDLVLMDVQMPEMDGFEATQAIRGNEAGTGCRIPIIALTANAAEEDRITCLQAGMDDFLTKPVKSSRLFETIYKNLSNKRGNEAEENIEAV